MAAVALGANIIFSLLFMGPLDHGGLALALSLASTLQFCLLVFFLKKRMDILDLKPILLSTGKCALGSIVMGVGIFYATQGLGLLDFEAGLGHLIPNLAGLILFSALLYFLVTWILGCRELKSLLHILKPKQPVP